MNYLNVPIYLVEYKFGFECFSEYSAHKYTLNCILNSQVWWKLNFLEFCTIENLHDISSKKVTRFQKIILFFVLIQKSLIQAVDVEAFSIY